MNTPTPGDPREVVATLDIAPQDSPPWVPGHEIVYRDQFGVNREVWRVVEVVPVDPPLKWRIKAVVSDTRLPGSDHHDAA